MNAIVPGPLEGELLGAADSVRVFVAPHPLKNDRPVELSVPAGATIAEIVDRGVKATGTRWKATTFTVYLGGHPVPVDRWCLVRPKPGTTIAMRPVPTGPFSAIFAAISGAIGAFKSFIAAAGIFGKLLMAGISFGVKLLLNALFAPKQPDQQQVRQKASYSIAGSRNQADPYGPVPVILGRHRVAPRYGAAPYTETVGSDQFLRMLFVVGYGPLEISDIKIGETPIDDFEGVSYRLRSGFNGEANTALYPRQVIEEQLGIELFNDDSWQRRTTAEDITEISIDILWPRGLIKVDKNGKRQAMRSAVDWRYRKVGAGSWTNGTGIDFRRATQDIIRRTFRADDLDEGQYEVEVRKATADIDPPANTTIVDSVQWTAVRGFRNGEPLTFEDPIAVIALRIKATSQLNGTVDTLNCVATSVVTAWDGDSWEDDTASRNPADLYRHVLQSPANKRPVADARIDLATLQDWHAYCVTNGWTYDREIAATQSVYDTLLEICSAGRAMPVFRDGKWSVVWDEQDLPVVQMFTPRNSWGFEAQHRYEERPHAFRARFANADKGYAADERIVYDDGFTSANATRFEGIEFPGVTDADLVWKHGRFHIAQLRLRPATYTLNVDFEGLVLTRGDRVRVQHDVMLVGLNAGRVTAVDVGNQTVTVDETLTLDGADSYMLRCRRADGTFLTRDVASSATGELTEIPLDGTDDLPAVGDLFAFGLSGAETAIYRVLGIEPRNDHMHRLTLVDDAPEISDADTGTIPEFDGGITLPVDPFTLPPTNIRITDGVHEHDGQFYAFLGLVWKLPRLGRVETVEVEYQALVDGDWRPGGSFPPGESNTTIFTLNAGLYKARVRSIFDDGTFSRWLESETYDADALVTPPADVSEFRISTTGDTSTLSWLPVSGAGVTFEIRFAAADVSMPTWNSAVPLLPSISGTSAQVQTMIGTYFIKAKLPTGLLSDAATSITSNILAIAGFNVVETLTESPAFAGTKDATVERDGELRLKYRDRITDWPTLSSILRLQLGTGDAPGFEPEGHYYFGQSLDLGEVHSVRITADIEARGVDPFDVISLWSTLSSVARLGSDTEEWAVELQVRYTLVDPALADWTEWQTLVLGDVSLRGVEVRLRLQAGIAGADEDGTEYAATTPAVSKAAVTIDMPDRVVAGDDITVPVSGLTVTFDPAFRVLSGIGLAAQDLQNGDYWSITSKSKTGFDIIFRDGNDDPVERVFDYVAKGYGALLQ